MNIGELLIFVLGATFGVTFFFRVFVYIFYALDKRMNEVVQRRTIRHNQLGALVRAAAQIPSSMVESLCQLVHFDNNVVGEPIQCRAVFFGQTITLYQVDKLKTLPDHRQKVISEHFLFRINSSCVDVSSQRISRYHRHTNKASRFSTIRGRCLILRAKEGLSLFLEDPVAAAQRRIEAAKLERKKFMQEQWLLMRRMYHETNQRLGQDSSYPQLPSNQCVAELKDCGEAEDFSYCTDPITGSERDSGLDGAAVGLQDQYTNKRIDTNHDSGGHRRIKTLRGSDAAYMTGWRCIAVKFPTRRENERWVNLIQAAPQTHQWVDYLMHLPKIDVLNSLLGRLFFENMQTSGLHDLLVNKISKKLGNVFKKLPENVKGNITLDDLVIGGEVPLFNNFSEAVVSSCGDLSFDFDVLYRGGLILSFRVSITYRSIRVPDIIFHIKVLELAGRMKLNLGPPPTRVCWIGALGLPQLRLGFTQEVASHDGILHIITKIMPDMSQLVSDVVKVKLFEDMVLPNMEDFPWPVMRDSKASKSPSNAGN